MELLKKYKTGIICVVFAISFIGFLIWIKCAKQDWNYWNPIIHNGVAILVATCGGAVIGGWLTKNGFLSAIEHQISEAKKENEKVISSEVYPIYSDFTVCAAFLLISENASGIRNEKDFYLPSEIKSKIWVLSYLTFEDKKLINTFQKIVRRKIKFIRQKNLSVGPSSGMVDVSVLRNQFQKNNIQTCRGFWRELSKIEKKILEKCK